MVPDANENIRPAKDKATDRIDGFVALILAWGRAMFFEPYDQVGVKVIE
jgi:phage terminase large subunit-like protein